MNKIALLFKVRQYIHIAKQDSKHNSCDFDKIWLINLALFPPSRPNALHLLDAIISPYYNKTPSKYPTKTLI